MNKMDLKKGFLIFRDGNILPDPASVFISQKNTFFDLEIPYSHVLLFSAVEYEEGLTAICNALGLPCFHKTAAHGNGVFFDMIIAAKIQQVSFGTNDDGVFIEINEDKRLVVDFLFDYQIEERIAHYGHLLGAYLLMAETVLNEK